MRSVWDIAMVMLIAASAGVTPVEAAATFRTVRVTSTIDGAAEPALYWSPDVPDGKRVPLLVVLHTWSGGYNQRGFGDACLAESEKRGWAIIQPNFRGPNKRPEACGSELAVQDVLDAVAYVKQDSSIDDRRVYLVGTSGGGHMAMLMAGRHPRVWAGVSAWVGISDLAAWHAETTQAGRKNYAGNIEAVVGGKPGSSAKVEAELRQRSPLTHLANAKGLAIDLQAGIHDGHTGSVPVSHTLRAFNILAKANGHVKRQLTDEQIAHMTTQRQVPQALASERADEDGRKHRVLFRRVAGAARVTIFEGGHEGDMGAAINWLAKQKRVDTR